MRQRTNQRERMAAVVLFILLAILVLLNAGDSSPAALDRTLYSAAKIQYDRGNYDSASLIARNGYDRRSTPAGSRREWDFRVLLAHSLLELDRVEEAEALLRQRAPAPHLEAQRLAALAYARYRRQEYEAARTFLKQAEALAGAEVDETRARIELTRGMIEAKTGHYSEAESSFRRVLASLSDPDSSIAARAYINVGFLYLSQHRCDEALPWLERVRSVSKKTGARDLDAFAVGNLGVAYLCLGDLDRSVKLLSEAVTLAERSKDEVLKQRWLDKAGEAYEVMGDYSRASECLRSARALAKEGIDDDWTIDVLANLTGIALTTGDLSLARRLNAESRAIAARLNTPAAGILPSINAGLIAAARKQFDRADGEFRAAVDASRSVGDVVSLWQSYSGLAASYRAAGRLPDAGREYRNALNVIEMERSKLRLDEQRMTFLASLIRFYQDYVDFLMDRGEQMRALEVAIASRARVMAERAGRTDALEAGAAGNLRRLAAETGVVLLTYWVAPGRSFLWVIDAAGVHAFVLPGQNEIAARATRWQSAVAAGDDPFAAEAASGRWLFAHLIGDHYSVPPGSRVVVIPDSILNYLNFETLPAADGRRYWIEDVTAAVAPSAALLRRSEPARGRLLLIGDPDFATAEYPRLPHVKSEIGIVSGQFADRDVYTGPDATPDAYRRAEPERYAIIHFAAHSVANIEAPLDSAVMLAGPADNHKLYARDILSRPLRAHLVTLSACQTAGRKNFAGEGLTGFAWAFLSAGAENVIAGMWDVDDRATSELMARFYAPLPSGVPPAASLREAKLALMRSSPIYRKPYYWAAFQTFTRALYGPGRQHSNSN